MVKRQTRELQVRVSNSGPGSNFDFKSKIVIPQGTHYKIVICISI